MLIRERVREREMKRNASGRPLKVKIASESKIRDQFKATFDWQPEYEIALESRRNCLKKAKTQPSELLNTSVYIFILMLQQTALKNTCALAVCELLCYF